MDGTSNKMTEELKNIAVIIPAYNPDVRLAMLIEELLSFGLKNIIVIDDGSKSSFSLSIFHALKESEKCVLYRHVNNMGKGAALKTGLQRITRLWPDCTGFVTADADGQHSAADIVAVGRALTENPDSLILGVRDFGVGDIPTKSKLGNEITKVVFRFVAGRECADTQTGLRGLPRSYISTWLEVAGSRYEYEMNLLLRAAGDGIPFVEVPIQTLYYDGNRQSHFRPWRDSILIYLNILRFGISSVLAALVDLAIFTLLNAAFRRAGTDSILLATIMARIASGAVNYLVNRNWVFQSRENAAAQAAKYILLFLALMLSSWWLVESLHRLTGFHSTLIKAVVDSALFLISYQVQRRFIFKTKRKKRKGESS